jgi:PhoPQ-activated pathogenicity-related protein
MALTVVDLFEAVDVDEREYERGAGAMYALESVSSSSPQDGQLGTELTSPQAGHLTTFVTSSFPPRASELAQS